MIRYSKDTRTIRPGEYYVAIRGDRFDGHDFIPDAIAKGAAGLVVERDVSGFSLPAQLTVRQVENSIDYLAQEARQKLKQLCPDVVAVTGSVGKTTTKNAIATVLSQAFSVTASKGNLNTPLGLSLTILNELTEETQKLVVEMGAAKRGEIAELCAIVPPSVAVVTNVYPVHLETMGTIENVARTKGEIVEALTANGTACLNYDDPYVRQMANLCHGQVLFYGKEPRADIKPTAITVNLQLLGQHAVYLALAAYCVGRCFSMSDRLINKGLSVLKAEKGRLSKLPGVNNSVLIDDSYNSSPSAALAALTVLENETANRRIAILGDMLELGEIETSEHERVVEYALGVSDILILVGPRMKSAFESIEQSKTKPNKRILLFNNSQDATDALQSDQIIELGSSDVVLVKGSAGLRMEKVTKQLLAANVDPVQALVRQGPSWKNI